MPPNSLPDPTPDQSPKNGLLKEIAEEPTASTSPTLINVASVGTQLSNLVQRMNRLQRTVRLTIEADFASLSGHQFGSLAANEEVARLIHEILESHGLRIQCPECGHAAILRCSRRDGVAHGVFVMDHSIEGRRTFHGGYSTLPALRLVAKPKRRSKKKAS